MRNLFAIILLIAGIIIAVFVWYQNSNYSTVVRPFSSYTLLSSSWDKYKSQFINSAGRVLDHSQNDVTTSEGQSYAMLRAVWIGDKKEFDLVWVWTKQTLKRPNDNLFGWKWGKRGDGSYGFLEGGGDNSASDADSDIALALILASRRWNDQSYSRDAHAILIDMWNIETAQGAKQRFLIAGNWAQSSDTLVVNPSYLAPYAYRIFAKVDTTDDWQQLVASSYYVLNNATHSPLDKKISSNLPPDWVYINRTTEQLKAPTDPKLTTDFSFDAVRVPWRIALDYQWNKSIAAKEYLLSNFSILKNDYEKNHMLPLSFTHDGQVLQGGEGPLIYATSIGYFMLESPSNASDIFQHKIIDLYSNDSNSFNSNIPYYEQNWLWFGAGLYLKFLNHF